MKRFKTGDKVSVFDGSWSMTINNSKLIPCYGSHLINRYFKVVMADMVLPKSGSENKDCVNDLYLKAMDDGQIVFICSDFVSPVIELKRSPEKECPRCFDCGFYQEWRDKQ